MIHRIEPEICNLHGNISRDLEPILAVDSGDMIVAGTRCCAWGAGPPETPWALRPVIEQDLRRDPKNDVGLCLNGPIAIRGAEPGMVLEVSIDELRVGAYGVTMTGGGPCERDRRLGLDEETAWMMWKFDLEKGIAHSSTGHSVKMSPFLGYLGVTPAAPGSHSNTSARQVGGNMDCRALVPGSKLYLPIEVPEALFSFGDGHAAQGDGEMGGWAIECPMDVVRLTLRIRDDMHPEWPVARTPDAWVTFGFHEDLTEATYMAANNMLDLLVERLGVSRKEAYMLGSQTIDLRITQIVNPTRGVHAIWRDHVLGAE